VLGFELELVDLEPIIDETVRALARCRSTSEQPFCSSTSSGSTTRAPPRRSACRAEPSPRG
jgi:hypothetical protein